MTSFYETKLGSKLANELTRKFEDDQKLQTTCDSLVEHCSKQVESREPFEVIRQFPEFGEKRKGNMKVLQVSQELRTLHEPKKHHF